MHSERNLIFSRNIVSNRAPIMERMAMLAEIEAAAVRGWPALETAPIDGWLWRYTSGGSVRGNSVAALAFSGHDVDAAIAAAEALAAQRRAPACFSVSDVSAPKDLDARLAARGYERGDDHVTMAKQIDPKAPLPMGVTLEPTPSTEWMEAYLSGLTPDRRAMAPRIVERLPAQAVFVGAHAGDLIGTSGLTIGDGRVASVQCMATRPEAQRSGGARRVLAAIEHLAACAGRELLYLQTSADNIAAQALYCSTGFAVIGHYHTRTKRL